MKVKELIGLLRTYDKEMEVLLKNYEGIFEIREIDVYLSKLEQEKEHSQDVLIIGNY